MISHTYRSTVSFVVMEKMNLNSEVSALNDHLFSRVSLSLVACSDFLSVSSAIHLKSVPGTNLAPSFYLK